MTENLNGYLEPLLSGLLITFSFMCSIGPQNAFLVRHGLARKFVPHIVAFCIMSDFILIGLGVFGAAEILEQYYYAAAVMGSIGILCLLGFSYKYFKNALTIDESMKVSGRVSKKLSKVIAQTFIFTFANPVNIIETVVLIGGLSSKYKSNEANVLYFLGAGAASTIWFSSLGFFTRFLYPFFKKPISWKILDILSGTVMLIVSGIISYNLYYKYF
ncbi:MAG: LysE family transporter [Rickettsiales bacterium]